MQNKKYRHRIFIIPSIDDWSNIWKNPINQSNDHPKLTQPYEVAELMPWSRDRSLSSISLFNSLVAIESGGRGCRVTEWLFAEWLFAEWFCFLHKCPLSLHWGMHIILYSHFCSVNAAFNNILVIYSIALIVCHTHNHVLQPLQRLPKMTHAMVLWAAFNWASRSAFSAIHSAFADDIFLLNCDCAWIDFRHTW